MCPRECSSYPGPGWRSQVPTHPPTHPVCTPTPTLTHASTPPETPFSPPHTHCPPALHRAAPQGIAKPLEAKLRPKGMGMGFGDYTEHKLVAEGKEREKPKEEVVRRLSCSCPCAAPSRLLAQAPIRLQLPRGVGLGVGGCGWCGTGTRQDMHAVPSQLALAAGTRGRCGRPQATARVPAVAAAA